MEALAWALGQVQVGRGQGPRSSGAGEVHIFVAISRIPSLITPPWVSGGGALCWSTLLPPERWVPEKVVEEEESCSAFKSPHPKTRKPGDEGGGGSHSHKLGAYCYQSSPLAGTKRGRRQTSTCLA